MPLDGKVSAKDTNGSLYIFEHTDMGKGGPPRHVHSEQDEWFYVTRGEFKAEVGDEKFTLKPGDSLFAPRKVPHAWACVSEKGTMLLAVQPAGTMEAFFRDLAKVGNRRMPPTKEEMAKVFKTHGMEVVGEPLKVE
jgi:mannose-6-phosphate isomerase-like protein (cupin superfamily)